MTETSSPNSGKPTLSRSNLLWTLAFWMLISLMFQQWMAGQDKRQLSYSDFKHYTRQGRVVEVTMRGNAISGMMRPAKGAGIDGPPSESAGAPGSAGSASNADGYKNVPFQTHKPSVSDPGLMALLESKGVAITAEPVARPWFLNLLMAFLPWLLIVGLFVFINRRIQQRMQGQGGLFGFGKSRAKRFKRSTDGKTYEDVAGLENTKKELQEIVAYLKDPSKFRNLGGELPRGLLLVGPPGVGKTLMAQATAGEADVPFYSISGSEFIEMFVGVGASRVRDMFAKAKRSAPSLIFIDELDSIGRARGTGLGGGHDEREQTLNQILSEMDGFAATQAVVVMAATNRPDVLDPALVRPGRFDRHIVLDMPRKAARKKILETHTREVPLADDVDLGDTAEKTVGMSGAQLKNLVNEAALMAARKEKDRVDADDFEQARDKILMGIEREDVIADDEKEMVAYHEAGHALMAELLSGADPLQKVSIIPRGRALGVTEQLPDEERTNMKRRYLRDRLAILLGGRAAEKLVFEDVSTGAGDDIQKATRLARRMVCQWGMSDRLGAVAFKNGEPHPFLGRELTEPKDYSEHTAQIIDAEVGKVISGMEEKAVSLLSAQRQQLDSIADALLVKETLDRNEVTAAIETASAD